MKDRYLRTCVLVLFFVLFFFLSKTTHAAASSQGLELYPAFSEVVLTDPKQEKTVEITVVNHNQFPVSVKVFPIDFKQAGTNGQIDFIGQNEKGYSYSLSSFLSFASTLYTIEPQKTETIKVTAKNRDDLSPGGHYAAVVVQVETDGTSTDQGTRVSQALSSLILLRKVGGEQFNLSLVDVSWPQSIIQVSLPKTIDLLFQNEGNIHMTPYGTVEVYDMFNRLISKGIINVSSQRIFPETQRYLQVVMESQNFMFPLSLNSIRIRGSDSLHKTRFVYNSPFLYVDIIFMIVIVLLLIGAVLLRIRIRRKK